MYVYYISLFVLDCSSLQIPASQLLQTATAQRQLVEDSLTYEGARPRPENIIAAMERYLYSLWQVKVSLAKAGNVMIRVRVRRLSHLNWGRSGSVHDM